MVLGQGLLWGHSDAVSADKGRLEEVLDER